VIVEIAHHSLCTNCDACIADEPSAGLRISIKKVNAKSAEFHTQEEDKQEGTEHSEFDDHQIFLILRSVV
jgi:Na+-translocating ferredoxin:NAD+ oxidoreductase RNF subunit RnfB